MAAAFEAVIFGKLCYRLIEKEELETRKTYKGNFESKMTLSVEARTELIWWKENILTSTRSLLQNSILYKIYVEASKLGCRVISSKLRQINGS